jgi:hypothetical protein
MPKFQTMLWLLALQGLLGAFDTLYFHELRARLPALGKAAKGELLLHSARSVIYAVFFMTLPWLTWQGWWAAILIVLLALEIVITMYDFVIEDLVRKPLGGVYPAERVMHGVLGVLYGVFLATLFPMLYQWWAAPSGFAFHTLTAPFSLKIALSVMGSLSFLSGLRDLFAALALPHSSWPWSNPAQAARLGN